MTDKHSALFNESLQRMRLLCSKQERCSNEIRLKLAGGNLNDREIEKIMSVLLNENFINDERYAISFTHDRLKFNKWGRIKIRHQLRQKGIIDDCIQSAFEEIDSTEYKLILKDEMVKKYKSLHKSGNYKLKGKLMRFGQGRGFETDLVFQVIDEVLNEKDQNKSL